MNIQRTFFPTPYTLNPYQPVLFINKERIIRSSSPLFNNIRQPPLHVCRTCKFALNSYFSLLIIILYITTRNAMVERKNMKLLKVRHSIKEC